MRGWALVCTLGIVMLGQSASARDDTPTPSLAADSTSDGTGRAESEPESKPMPAGADRGLDVLTAIPIERHTFLLTLTHRAHETFLKDPFDNLLGLDGKDLRWGVGLRYGAFDAVDIGVYRYSGGGGGVDTYELDGRWRFVSAEVAYVDIGIRLGAVWLAERGNHAFRRAAQLMVNRWLKDRVLLGTVLAFHSGPYVVSPKEGVRLAAAVMGLCEVRLIDGLAWNLEASWAFTGNRSKWPIMTTGLKWNLGKQSAAMVVSNTQGTTLDGLLINSSRGLGDLLLGFNLWRTF